MHYQNGTRYFEKYAKLTLQYRYNENWDDFILSESPDLQSGRLNIGIEVTRAISIREKITYGHLDYIKDEIVRYYPVVDSGDIKVEDHTAILGGHKIHLEEIEQSIRTKTRKLNKNYEHFRHNHLYIFTFDNSLYESDILQAVDIAQEMTGNESVQYECYFINCVDKLYVVGRQNLSIERYNFDAGLLKRLEEDTESGELL